MSVKTGCSQEGCVLQWLQRSCLWECYTGRNAGSRVEHFGGSMHMFSLFRNHCWFRFGSGHSFECSAPPQAAWLRLRGVCKPGNRSWAVFLFDSWNEQNLQNEGLFSMKPQTNQKSLYWRLYWRVGDSARITSLYYVALFIPPVLGVTWGPAFW